MGLPPMQAKGDVLDRLPQAHVVGQAGAQTAVGEKGQPADASLLLGSERTDETGWRKSHRQAPVVLDDRPFAQLFPWLLSGTHLESQSEPPTRPSSVPPGRYEHPKAALFEHPGGLAQERVSFLGRQRARARLSL